MRLSFPRRLLFVLLVVSLQACCTRTPAPTDAAGRRTENGIALIEPVTLGGLQQWLLIRGADRNKPVLLFLHGGPGSPYMGFAHTFQAELEKNFVVVQWDQRGAGKSYPDTPPSSMRVAQFQSDTHELVMLLRKRFNRDKIYLLGHSWGAYLGIHEARNHPENLYAYVGTGQMIDLVKQEKISHGFVAERARTEGNAKALKELEEVGEPPYRDAVKGFNVKYSWLWKYGGMIEGETGPAPFVKGMIGSKEYSPLDIYHFIKGASFSLEQLAKNEAEGFWRLKAPQPESGFQVPVFFIVGEKDRVTPAVLVADYEARLKAPMKKSFVLPDAGHFAFFTHPQRFSAAMSEVLGKTYPAQ